MGGYMMEVKYRANIRSIAFFPDGKDFVSGGFEGKIRRARAESGGGEVGDPMNAGNCVLGLAVSQDGKWIVGGLENGRVTVWSAETHERAMEIDTGAKAVYAVDVSLDATQIASESGNRAVSVWSVSTGRRILGPWKHDGSIAGVKYAPNGVLLATATLDRAIRIYDSRAGRLLVSDIPVRVCSYLNQSFTWATVSSSELIVLSKDGHVKYIDATTGRTCSQWPIHSNDKPRCVTLAKNGKFIAAAANSSISFWDTGTHQQIGDVLQHDNVVRTLVISPDLHYLVSSTDNQKIAIRDLGALLPKSYLVAVIEKVDIKKAINPPSNGNTGQAKTYIDAETSINSIHFHADGMLIVGGGSEGKVRRWRIDDGHEVGAALDAGGHVLNLAVSRDGRWIVSGTQKGSVMVWSSEYHEKVREIKGHTKPVSAVDISPDATRVVTGSGDSTACVWSIASGERLLDPLKHNDALVAVKYSFNGDLIATATWNRGKSIRVYNTRDGSLHFDVPFNVSSILNQSLAWSTNSEQLFALSKNGTITCFDVATGSTYSEWAIQSGDKPKCIAMASNGTFIAASANSWISFWDPITCKQVGRILDHGGAIRSMSISPDNAHLVSGGDDRKITICNIRGILPLFYFVDADPREPEIRRLKKEKTELEKTNASLLALIRAHEAKHRIEAVYAAGNVNDAAELLRQLVDAASDGIKTDNFITDWMSEFTKRCVTKLECIGDVASNEENHKEAITAYAAALSLPSPRSVLVKWAKIMLVHGSVGEALSASTKLRLPKVMILHAICDTLEGADRVTEAIDLEQTMESEVGKDPKMQDKHQQWLPEFHRRCNEKLAKLGDAAMDSHDYEGAIKHYSAALACSPLDLVDIYIKRSRARSLMGMWEEVLNDANEAIRLDPLCYQGYERKHAALHEKKRFDEAAEAFRKMLQILEESPDTQLHETPRQYIDISTLIQKIIRQTIRTTPRVLIDTTTGRLLDKTRQALAFEELPIFNELVSSMIMKLDEARIEREVEQYYQYVMLSHRWQDDEPLFETVENISVYELKPSPENIKLQTFCSLARSLGFRWAWSDTCCIDKSNTVVLNESLVAMFAWYHGSSLTIVHLLGISSQSAEPGDLRRSVWNTRAWTYQEYVASSVVRFYTEDWEPYLGLALFNHRESPVIISEMEQATGVSALELVALHPGLGRIREKLHLASTRQTTLVEDIAYSLFGIFNVSIAVMYGEGRRAVGRLLEYILSGSGDVTVLAWTGCSGRYNSCLPIDLTVYAEPPAPYIPRPVDNAEMASSVDALRATLPDSSLAERLYDKLYALPLPSLAFQRLKLPGICFPLEELVPAPASGASSTSRLYRATTSGLADFEIWTRDDLSEMQNLVLIHPWIRPLLDQEFSQGADAFDKPTRALRFLVCLMEPFGGLLLEPISRVEYRRVAADNLIIVRVRAETPVTDLMANIRTVDIQ